MVIGLALLSALVAGSWIYCVLTVVSAWRYRRVAPPAPRALPSISVLKPLAGIDDGLEENLVSFFEQDYPDFEILFAVRNAEDPAAPLAEKLMARYPAVASRLLLTGEPPYANAKVYSLDRMLAAARYDLIVMADSDVRFAPGTLAGIAAEFQDPTLGLATCPYRAVPGRGFWSRLEALGLNTDFLGGVLVARCLDGMKFAIGPTIAARRATLAAIGGFNAVKDYLAEDFVMGKLAAEHGFGVLLSSRVIEHRIGSQPFANNLKHRLRWTRSTRRSRPRGYIGQVFTHPIPLALLLVAVQPSWWPLAAVTCLARAAAIWATGILVLRDPLTRRWWWLTPAGDIASFLVWLAGFHGKTILWRGRKYNLLPDGRFELLQEG